MEDTYEDSVCPKDALDAFRCEMMESRDPVKRLLGVASVVLYQGDGFNSTRTPEVTKDGEARMILKRTHDVVRDDVPGIHQNVTPLCVLGDRQRPTDARNEASVYIARVDDMYVCVAENRDDYVFCLLHSDLELAFYSHIESAEHHFALGHKDDKMLSDSYAEFPEMYDLADLKQSMFSAYVNYVAAFGGTTVRDVMSRMCRAH